MQIKNDLKSRVEARIPEIRSGSCLNYSHKIIRSPDPQALKIVKGPVG